MVSRGLKLLPSCYAVLRKEISSHVSYTDAEITLDSVKIITVLNKRTYS